jgi:hypothetical protein
VNDGLTGRNISRFPGQILVVACFYLIAVRDVSVANTVSRQTSTLKTGNFREVDSLHFASTKMFLKVLVLVSFITLSQAWLFPNWPSSKNEKTVIIYPGLQIEKLK